MSCNSYDLQDQNSNYYFLNKKRTNFTYAESSSYKSEPEKRTWNEPYLMREPLHQYVTELNYELSVNKSINNKAMRSVSSTPSRNRKSIPVESDRILRPRTYKTTSTNMAFVREYDQNRDYDNDFPDNSYVFGALNTNTNNSGPDQLENKRIKTNMSCNYDVSGDEGVGSDAFDSDTRDGMFGSNNANYKNPLMQKRDRIPNQSIQRNMFDSDETINQDLSETISGDELYDINPHPKSNFYRNKWSRSQHRKPSKNNSYTTNRHFNNIVCSPSALLISVIEWIYKLIILVTRSFTSRIRLGKRNSQLFRWLLMPVYFPWRLVQSVTSSFVYSINRFFGTSIRRQINSHNQPRKVSTSTWFYRILWLLFFLTAIFILWHFAFNNNNELNNTQPSHSLNFNLHYYASRVVGHDCMTKSNCCHNLWEVTQRFSSCLLSLPFTKILSEDKILSNNSFEEPSKLLKSNTSSSEEILEQIKIRLDSQDKKLSEYDLTIKDYLTKFASRQLADETISEIKKTVANVSKQISHLQSDFSQWKINVEKKLENLTESQKESVTSLTSNLEHVKRKLEENVNSLFGWINETEQHSSSNSEITKNLETQIVLLNIDMANFKNQLNEVDTKTISLVEANKKLISDSANLKKEILDEVDKEIRKLKLYRDDMIGKLNEEMSQLEHKINSAKLSNKEELDKLIMDHFSGVKAKITDINSTLWNNIENHVRTLLQSNEIKGGTSPNIFTSTNCLPSNYRYLRCPAMCVRVHQVRRLLKDALNLFAADKIGIPDFALESSGGTIATVRCTETYTDRASTLTVFGIPLLRLTNSPRTIIQPNLNPGECWPMKGTRGSVVVQLSAKVKVTAVSIDHIPKSLSPSESVDSAPRDFEIRAINDENDFIGKSIGNFTYLTDSDPVQTFHIQDPIGTKFVELIINSNYGNKEYTCLYRFRVHGKLFEN